ncbi:glycosyltransferase family 2 protein [Pedobacter sp. N36a]|uniref:glycosyltransferase family 2 protein n=1 Tax=Pedobacter sp. N36a TaxID=2767996 RepID=UPI00165696D8|nr:glycosyltransferase family 2 protein [Pedobacter sp. N36a]MBC8986445.1 glycosyltransferase family 2 protein [Pedobacter sp. N36a]
MPIRPLRIPAYLEAQQYDGQWFLDHVAEIREGIKRLHSDQAVVTVSIPAYNEEASILKTLWSLSRTITNQKVEILVVNNNSTDRTQELIELSGANWLIEKQQGVTHARNSGLQAAKGKIILNADADSFYSPYWVDLLSLPLKDPSVACTYGRFAFVSDRPAHRFPYFLYETAGDFFKAIKRRSNDEAMYVYGCSSGYRKEQGLQVDGYHHPPETNEDGYLALKLRSKFGKLHKITANRALVWTSDRRLMEQGGLFKAFLARTKFLLG